MKGLNKANFQICDDAMYLQQYRYHRVEVNYAALIELKSTDFAVLKGIIS